MTFFRRRRGGDYPTRPPHDPDVALPLLSVDDAALLVRLSQRAFAEAGRETYHDGRALLVGDGQDYPLTGLAEAVEVAPRSTWPDLVARHVEAMLIAHDTPEPTDFDAARELLRPQLRPADGAPGYAQQVLPGLVAVAALDYPTHIVELLRDEQVAGLGGWPQLREAGLANLRELPPGDLHTVDADPTREGSNVHLFWYDDHFGASRVLILDRVLECAGVAGSAHGLLIAVPTRHLLVVHPVLSRGVMSAMNLMVKLAQTEFDDSPGRLCRDVFYRTFDGHIDQITEYDDEREAVTVTVEGRLERSFIALGLLSSNTR